MNAQLKASTACIAHIKEFERLRLRAYQHDGDVPTIGWGHTAGVKLGDVATAQQAEGYLAHDVANCERDVRRLVTVPLEQGQFDALVDFVFNLGATRLRDSTLLALLNRGQYDAAGRQLRKWRFAYGRENQRLVERRAVNTKWWFAVNTKWWFAEEVV